MLYVVDHSYVLDLFVFLEWKFCIFRILQCRCFLHFLLQIIHLKRFQFVNGRWIKSQKIVKFPRESFDPSAFLVPRDPALCQHKPLTSQGDDLSEPSVPAEVKKVDAQNSAGEEDMFLSKSPSSLSANITSSPKGEEAWRLDREFFLKKKTKKLLFDTGSHCVVQAGLKLCLPCAQFCRGFLRLPVSCIFPLCLLFWNNSLVRYKEVSWDQTYMYFTYVTFSKRYKASLNLVTSSVKWK
jgi:hypothetical protein